MKPKNIGKLVKKTRKRYLKEPQPLGKVKNILITINQYIGLREVPQCFCGIFYNVKAH